MARLQSLGATAGGAWEEYKGWVFLGGTIYGIYTLRGLFSKLGDAADSGADALLSGVTEKAAAAAEAAKAKAQASATKAKATATTGGKRKFTDDEVLRFEADVESLATYLGRKGGIMQKLFVDRQSAFSLLKRGYSRLNLYNNKPFKWGYPVGHLTGNAVPITQTKEDKHSVANPYNWRVLAAPYKALTGYDLQADIRYYITGSQYKQILNWIL